MERSTALGLNYTYFPNLDKIMFEDGVCYTTEEAVILSKMKSPEDIRAAHLVKSVFGGTVLKESDGRSIEEQDKSWFELAAPVPGELPVEMQNGTSLQKQRVTLPPDSEIITMDL